MDDCCQVCCSSPERFLRGGRGKTLEAKPIKGTARRILGDAAADAVAAAALAASEKVSQTEPPFEALCRWCNVPDLRVCKQFAAELLRCICRIVPRT